ncbi:MAG: hypothetical protein LQ345_004988 [Seirophora villosa]|nr:MAG: hypothetical protein LQ345_004988 [Seirophora villosa]
MNSYTLPRPLLSRLFKPLSTRPFSAAHSLFSPEPQESPSTTSAPQPPDSSPRPVQSISGLRAAATAPRKRSAVTEATASFRTADLSALLHRRFRPGDVYAPHDLASVEQSKHRPRRAATPRDAPALPSSKSRRAPDAFDALALHPLDAYYNVGMMSEFVSSMGRIRHRRETGLRGVNQRRVARAVRRAVGMGLMPSVHRHPEMMERERAGVARRRNVWAYRGGSGGGTGRRF